MTASRSPGRYNLHRLGWVAFEDLCMQIMRVVLGETCSRFRPGPDGGRDGWYEGTAAGLLRDQVHLQGAFVIQCKHTSLPHAPLHEHDIKDDLEKLRRLAQESPSSHYILMTNRQVTAGADTRIRAAAEAIPGVISCLIFSETWIEDTIDATPRLLRLVPRLYGIGDISQIVSFVLQEQTKAVMDDLALPLRTFVPTESYRWADRALHEHGFVVLVGPPASGKTSIAAHLCMVTVAQEPNTRILRIEEADQFKSSWSPADSNTVYWVDDVFGETTLDEMRLREWSAAMDKIEAARRRKAKIVFCTRDYILASATQLIKKSKANQINDARVRVDVTALDDAERESILYNHIKDGDISKLQKMLLKAHLPNVARFRSFTPELARRLGNKRFHSLSQYTNQELRSFFDNPVDHFRDVIHGLSNGETAALASCLHSGNALPDPVPDGAIGNAVLSTYGVDPREIRESLERLEGSLVKRVRIATKQLWQLHHPSMLEALQNEIAARAAQLMLYLASAQLHAVLRDTTTKEPPKESRLVFVPEAGYAQLAARLHNAHEYTFSSVASYLAFRSTSSFLRVVDLIDRELIDKALGVVPEPEDASEAANLAVLLAASEPLLDQTRRAILEITMEEAFRDTGWIGFLDIDGLDAIFPGFSNNIFREDMDNGFSSIERVFEWYAQDLSSTDHIDGALEGLENHCNRLRRAAATFLGAENSEALSAISGAQKFAEKQLAEKREESEQDDRKRSNDLDYATWKDRQLEEQYHRTNGRFSDVDE